MTVASMARLAKDGELFLLSDKELAEGVALVLHLREQVDHERLRRALGAERAERIDGTRQRPGVGVTA